MTDKERIAKLESALKLAAAELCRKGLPKLWRTDK